jgi:hypothetical protein
VNIGLREKLAVTAHSRDVMSDANLQGNSFHATRRREHHKSLRSDVIVGSERCAQSFVILDLKLASVEGKFLENDAVRGELKRAHFAVSIMHTVSMSLSSCHDVKVDPLLRIAFSNFALKSVIVSARVVMSISIPHSFRIQSSICAQRFVSGESQKLRRNVFMPA